VADSWLLVDIITFVSFSCLGPTKHLEKVEREQQGQKLEYEAMEFEAEKVIRDAAGTGSVVTLAHHPEPLSFFL
jgi:hypothetical protein